MVNTTLGHKNSVSYRLQLLHKSIDTAEIMHEVHYLVMDKWLDRLCQTDTQSHRSRHTR